MTGAGSDDETFTTIPEMRLLEPDSRDRGDLGAAHNRLRRHSRSRLAEEPVADVPSMASGWDPWAAVDSRVDAGVAALLTDLTMMKEAN